MKTRIQSPEEFFSDPSDELDPPLIDGLILKGEMMNLVGSTKSKKTWCVHSIALSVAMGIPWMGFNTTKGRVLVIDAELRHKTLRFRLRKTARSLGHTGEPCVDVMPLRGNGCTLAEISDDIAREPGKYCLIILDPLYRIMQFSDENSNAEMTRAYELINTMCEKSGASVIVVHHATKGNQSDRAVTDVGAGAGAQSRFADTHLVLRQHEAKNAIAFGAVCRSFNDPSDFVGRFDIATGWQRDDNLDPGALMRAPRRSTRKAEQKEKPAPPQPMDVETFAKALVTSTPQGREVIVEAAKAAGQSKAHAEDTLKLAVSKGLVQEVYKPGGPKRFVLPGYVPPPDVLGK